MPRGYARVYPRVHIGLIDLGDVTGRRYGGAGFAIDGLPTTAVARFGKSARLCESSTFQGKDFADIDLVCRRVSDSLGRGFEVSVECGAPTHVGLGSKTSAMLAVVMACNVLVGSRLSRWEIVRVTGRGGASGIGVNVPFVGGFVVDAGRAATPGRPFLPSSGFVCVEQPPPVVVETRFPESWRIHLFLPPGFRITGSNELAFFEKNTPVGREEVLEVLGCVYHGVVPAMINKDLTLLSHSIAAIRKTGFKRREISNQASEVRALLSSLDSVRGVAVGMSSMGPLVYCIANDQIGDLRSRFMSDYRTAYIGEYRGRNSGATLRVE